MTESERPAFNPLRYPIALADPEWVTELSGWVSHIPFAMALVQMLRPRTLVELGTYKGDSYCAFCQGVVASGAGTRCFAVDTWQGDAHAGALGPEALARLRAYHDPKYGAFSTLLQSDFDAATGRFEDRSIDLLHIDGLHTYDAVRHDYELWQPKLSDRAVVLFHDTAVRRDDFGVWQLWQEVSAGKPSFEFLHGHGLGVLGHGGNLSAEMLNFFAAANAAPDSVRRFFFTIGHRIDLYRNALNMIDGLTRIHQACERWYERRGQGLTALPNPVSDPMGFRLRIVSEVEGMSAQP